MSAVPSHPRFPSILSRLQAGESPTAIARDVGLTASQISGWWYRNKGRHGAAAGRPSGGETPRVSLGSDEGEATSKVYVGPDGARLDADDLLRGWHLDPRQWEIIDDTLTVNRWLQNAADDIWAYQYKARVRRRGTGPASAFDGLAAVTTDPRRKCVGCGRRFRHSRVGPLHCTARCRDIDQRRQADNWGIVRHVVIPDTQVRPGEPTDHLVWAGRYIREHCAGQRTRIIHLGDHWDMASLSSYDHGKKAAENRRVREDLEAGNRAFEVLDDAMGDDPQWEKHFLFGNHEERILRYVNEHAELDGFLSFDNCVTPDGWQRHGFLEPTTIDGVVYAHYFYQPNTGRPYSGENIEARVRQVGHSFVMGHQQGLRMGMHYAAGRQRYGVVAGSFYQHDEGYKGPQGNHHWRGIVVLNDVEDGSFDPMPVSLDYLCRRFEGHRLEHHTGRVV